MKKLLSLGLLLSGILSLTAFLGSLYKAWRLYILTPVSAPTLIYHFSMYLPDNRNSFFEGIIQGAERAAEELNSAVSIHSIDPAKNELETAAFTGVDGVIVCPYLDDALARRQLEKLSQYQMPAVLINHNLPNDRPWPFIGVNNFDMGRRIGMLSMLPGGEPVRLAVVYSDKAPGIYAERELVEMGISAALENRLEGAILRYRTNLNPLDAETLLVRLFRGGNGSDAGSAETAGFPGEGSMAINTIVFTDPADTIAAAQTLVDLNLVGRMQVIGFGADAGVTESIRKGIISASVVINSDRIGYEAVRSLAAIRTTGYTSTSIDTGIDIITGGNL
ncbi:MAG: substrate-binding domain-containing protein [Spirochaetaceae bacterium]|jgi:ribose transport system substrate-binding protein|nr:substrate-binding domain-containing protein [Spirochaetaceae bacterium]